MAKMRTRRIRGSFCEKPLAPKSHFDRRSFRYKKSGSSWLLIGCPKGKWNAKAHRCKVGTRAYKHLRKSKGRCPVGQKSLRK